MQTYPGVGALVEDDAGDDPPAVREDHHEDPRVAPLPGARVAQLADVAEVDLGDLAGRRDDRDGDVVGARSVVASEAATEALDLRVAALVGRLAEAQAIEDGAGSDGLVEQGSDLVAPVLDARPLLGRKLAGRAVLLDGRPQGRELRERLGVAVVEPFGAEGGAVGTLGLGAHLEHACDALGAVPKAVKANHLLKSVHRGPRSSHRVDLPRGDEVRGEAIAARHGQGAP